MNLGVKEGVRQHIEGDRLVDAALAQERKDFTHCFKRGCREHIAGELHQVRGRSILSDDKDPFAKPL